MPAYEVEVQYNSRVFDTIVLNADDKDSAEYDAMNSVRDSNPDALGVEVLEVKELG